MSRPPHSEYMIAEQLDGINHPAVIFSKNILNSIKTWNKNIAVS